MSGSTSRLRSSSRRSSAWWMRQVGVDRADPGVAGAAVRRPARHGQPEGQGAGVRGDQRAAGRFGDDAQRHRCDRAAACRRRPARRPPRRPRGAPPGFRAGGSPPRGWLPRPPGSPPRPAFMSHAPRAWTTPCASPGTNGSLDHRARSPAGTTSTWPCRIGVGPSPSPVSVPTSPQASLRARLRAGEPCGSAATRAGPATTGPRRGPAASRCPASRCCSSDSASDPVTLGTASSSSSRATAASSSSASSARASGSVTSRLAFIRIPRPLDRAGTPGSRAARPRSGSAASPG